MSDDKKLQSIKNDPQMKILDVSQSMGQHGGQILAQQRLISEVNKRGNALASRLANDIQFEDGLERFKISRNAQGKPLTEAELARIQDRLDKSIQPEEVLVELQAIIDGLDNPMRTLISIGNSLNRNSKEIAEIAKGSVKDVVRTALGRFVKEGVSRPTSVTLGGDGDGKTDPHTAAELEEKAEELDDLLGESYKEADPTT